MVSQIPITNADIPSANGMFQDDGRSQFRDQSCKR